MARRPDGKRARRAHSQDHGKPARRGDARVARVPGTRFAGKSTRDYTIDPAMVEIQPEPPPAERAAILIALDQMISTPRREEAPRLSAWAEAGRREALLSNGSGSRAGWVRDSGRLGGR